MRAAREGGWPVIQVLAYDQVFGLEPQKLRRHRTEGKFRLFWADLPGRRGAESGQWPQHCEFLRLREGPFGPKMENTHTAPRKMNPTIESTMEKSLKTYI